MACRQRRSFWLRMGSEHGNSPLNCFIKVMLHKANFQVFHISNNRWWNLTFDIKTCRHRWFFYGGGGGVLELWESGNAPLLIGLLHKWSGIWQIFKAFYIKCNWWWTLTFDIKSCRHRNWFLCFLFFFDGKRSDNVYCLLKYKF